MRNLAPRYQGVAPFYRSLELFYGGSAFRRCRAGAAAEVGPDERVLIAGVGRGDEIRVLPPGVEVVALDRSEAMLRRGRRLNRELGIDWRHQDLRLHEVAERYDAILCPFFLNVFSPAELRETILHLKSLLAEDGQILISDFAPAKSSFGGWLQNLYYSFPLIFFVVLTRNAFHGLYDYGAIGKELGFRSRVVRDYRVHGVGPKWFRVWSLRSSSEDQDS